MKYDYYSFAIVSGALCTLSFAPFNITLLFILSFAFLYVILHKDITKTQAFLIGLWFGIAHFSTSFYWFGIALATDIERFGLLIPLTFILFLFFGLYFGLAFFLFKICKYKNPITFAFIFYFCEYLRATLLSGFPWNLSGYTWNCVEILQSASIFGVWGLNFFTFFLSGAIGALFLCDSKANRFYITTAILLLVGAFCFGYFRLENNKTEYSSKKIRLVQANISHQARWSKNYANKVVNKYISLSIKQSLNNIDYVIWPESSLPFLLAKDSTNIPIALYSPLQRTLIAGGQRYENGKIYNSIFIINNGKISDYYDKTKLVPFGEYMPLADIIPIRKIVNGVSNFSKGADIKKIIESLDTIPTICYEAVFSASSHRDKNASWIINLTNDSWFGISTGQYQHFNMARLRAIEYGLPLVRATTTGISGVFDGYGRIIKTIELDTEGLIDFYLPEKTRQNTFYSKIRKAF